MNANRQNLVNELTGQLTKMLGCHDAGFSSVPATALNTSISGSIVAVPDACFVITMVRWPNTPAVFAPPATTAKIDEGAGLTKAFLAMTSQRRCRRWSVWSLDD